MENKTVLMSVIAMGVLIIFGINSAYASSISCDGNQTIIWNEELQKKECANEDGTTGEVPKKKKSESKPFNLEGFTFDDTLDTRKNPLWVNWIPANQTNVIVKSALEQRIENDKIGSNGITRDHYQFGDYVQQQEVKSLELMKELYPDLFKEEPFSELDNIYTHDYPSESHRDRLMKQLEEKDRMATMIKELQEQIANRIK